MFTPTLAEARENAQKVRDWLKTKHEPTYAEGGTIVTKNYPGSGLRVAEIVADKVTPEEVATFCDGIQPAIYHRVYRYNGTLYVWFFYKPKRNGEKDEGSPPEDYEQF